MDGDPLADVLTLASARCVRIGTLKAGGTWALTFPPPQKIKLIAVVKGRCWLAVDGERAPLRLETGDVFMVPAERSYVLASDLKASQLDGLVLFTKATDSVGTVGNGKDFFAIGGHVALDADRGGLLADVLPALIHIEANSSEASTIRWLLDQLVKEVTAIAQSWGSRRPPERPRPFARSSRRLRRAAADRVPSRRRWRPVPRTPSQSRGRFPACRE
jgi:hypothetical protein